MHKFVCFADSLRSFDDFYLTGPYFLRPGKLDDRVVATLNVFEGRWDLVGGIPSPGCACRTANKVEPVVDGIILREDVDSFIRGEGGLQGV